MEKQENMEAFHFGNRFGDVLAKRPLVYINSSSPILHVEECTAKSESEEECTVKSEIIDICDSSDGHAGIQSDDCVTSFVSEEERAVYCNAECIVKKENTGDTMCQEPLLLAEQDCKNFTIRGKKNFKTSMKDINKTSIHIKDLRIVLERIDMSSFIHPVIKTENAELIASHFSDNKNGDCGDEGSGARIISIPSNKERRNIRGPHVGRRKDEVLAENGNPVSQVEKNNVYPSCPKKAKHSKSRVECIVSGVSQQNKCTNKTSDVLAVPESEVNGNCQCGSTDRRNQKVPITRHVGDKSHKHSFHEDGCTVEGKVTANIKLETHVRVNTVEKPFHCSVCDFSCNRKWVLKNHMLTHSADKRFQCPYCEYRCIKKEYLNSHIMTHTGDKPFQCSYCEYRCTQKGSLKIHILTHTGVKPFKCSFCNYRCTQRGHLKSHVLIHTGVKPFQCANCDYKCIRKEGIKEHMLIHTAVKPLQCSYCDYKCSQKGSLKSHLLIHTGVQPFQCCNCNYKSYRKGDLKKHMLTHSAVKPFHCPHCEYKCSRKKILKKHLLTHTGVKPFQCSDCEYRCFQERNLKAHMLTHTASKRMRCPQCEYQCTTMQDLMTHVKIHK